MTDQQSTKTHVMIAGPVVRVTVETMGGKPFSLRCDLLDTHIQLRAEGVQILVKNILVYQNYEVGTKVRISDDSIGVCDILMRMETLKLTPQSREVSTALGYEDDETLYMLEC